MTFNYRNFFIFLCGIMYSCFPTLSQSKDNIGLLSKPAKQNDLNKSNIILKNDTFYPDTNALKSRAATNRTSTKTTCSAGQYLKAGQKTCSQCLENNYCKGGTYTFNSGSDQGITKCLSNTYSPKGSSVCIACEKGIMELSSSATAICKACPSGKVPNSAHSQCVQSTVCSTPGTYFNGSSCKPADKGYYVPSGSTTQKPCTGNTYSDVTGATSCKACPKATALAASVDTSKGDNGYFYYSTDGIHSRLGTGNGSSGGGCYVYLKSNEKNGKHNEVNCLFSQKTNDYGTDTTSGGLCRTDNKTQCNSGYHLNTKNVASTGFYWANSYKDLENTCITSTSSKITCSAGQYLKAGQKTCSQCLENNSCKGGTYTAGSSDQGITKCLANTYSPKGSAICIACEKGIMELSSSATAICKACPSGKIPNSAHSQCVQSSISDKTSFLKVSQHDMLFGPSKNSDTPLAEQCWTKTDIITYKQCILGDSVSTSTNTTQNKSKIKKDIKVNTKLLKKS